MKKSLLLLLSSSLFLGCSAQSGEVAETTALAVEAIVPDFAPDFDTAAMDTLLSGAVDDGKVIGVSALVFDEGQVVYENAFGLGDRERNVPLTKDSVFRIYSMTKPITSVIIMDLMEDGKISLDDPVSKYIPELANMKVASLDEGGQPKYDAQINAMTVKDLLLHRGGIAYGIFPTANPVEALYSKADMFNPDEDLSVKMDKLSKLPLIAQPGTAWYYSFSIDVLGRIIEVVTDKSLGEVMEARVLGPLGMTETSFYVHSEQASRFVTNYFLQEDGSFTVAEDGQASPYLKKPAFESGGGGLVSTLGDYSKFATMMLNEGRYDGGRILETETVNMMMSNQMDEDDIFLMPWLGRTTGTGFGYGGSVQVSVTPEQVKEAGRQVGQWGWGGLARTNFYVDPKNNAFGVIMLQYMGGEDPQLRNQFQALAVAQTQDATQD